MMSYLVTAQTMATLDRTAIEEYGIPGVALMELAGAGTAKAIIERWPKARRVGILAGGGNNGGDGYVIARHLLNAGRNVTTYLLAERKRISGDARTNLEVLLKMNAPVVDVPDPQELRRLHRDLENMRVLVDAMLGTGLKSNLKGIYKEAVEALNSARVPICAVDMPSGLSADTGRPMGDAVRAAMTCAYGLKKIGQVIYPGVVYVGDLRLVDIGLPREMVERLVEKIWLIEPEWAQLLLPLRDAEAHKGDFGHLLLLAGSPGKTGAAAMAANSAVMSGAGLVTAAVPQSLNTVVETKTTEAMTLPLADNGGYVSMDSWNELEGALEKAHAIAIGPGLGTDESTAELFFKLVDYTSLPMVIDADGLNILAENPESLKSARSKPVITPHPGEMGRLLNVAPRRVQDDRIAAARQCVELTGAVVLLKGARTIIAEPDGRLAINPTGNPGMAAGGTGDVLTGVLGALLAQGMQPFEAACAAAWIHGRAGDLAEKCVGRVSLKATDIIDNLPMVFRDLTGR